MKRLLLPLPLALLPVLADAADLSGNAGVLFDPVDRGLSLAREEASAAGDLYADFGKGFWVGVAAMRVDEIAGNDARLTASGGRTIAVGAYELDLSVSVDAFVGGDDFLYPEARAQLSRDLGLLKATAGLAVAPDGRWAVRDEATAYGWLEAEIPVTDVPWLTVVGHVGHEAIADSPDKTDWGLGLAAGWNAFEFSVGYEDSNRDIRIGRARLTAALRLFF